MAAAGPGTLVALATGDVIKVRIATIWQSQLGLQVRYYRVTVAVGGPMQGEIARTLDGIYAPQLKPCLHIAATYRGTDVQRIRPLPPTRWRTRDSAPWRGTASRATSVACTDSSPSARADGIEVAPTSRFRGRHRATRRAGRAGPTKPWRARGDRPCGHNVW